MLLNFITNMVVICCVFFILVAVLIDFSEFQKRDQIKKEKKSVVETGTMLLFFLFFYYLIRFNIGQMNISDDFLRTILIIFGMLILVLGCWVNLRGRINLGKNWSNQIKIYRDHFLVTDGVYRFVRHPLYASIIWMFLGASLIYTNYLSFLANVFIFIPFMYYRAKQEENLLGKEFKDYKNYQLKTGMFFPKVFKKYEKI